MRPWQFERVPNKIIRGLDNALIYTSTKEACLTACLNEVNTLKNHTNQLKLINFLCFSHLNFLLLF